MEQSVEHDGTGIYRVEDKIRSILHADLRVIEQDPSDISNIYETAIDVVRRLRQRFSRNEILFVLAVAMLICCPSKEHD